MNRTVPELIASLKQDVRYNIHDSSFLPPVSDMIQLPHDILEFYSICGGLDFIIDESFRW
ncbi:MAG: hypothetical protein ACPG7F_03040 [Aggregatilineales bacterium]